MYSIKMLRNTKITHKVMYEIEFLFNKEQVGYCNIVCHEDFIEIEEIGIISPFRKKGLGRKLIGFVRTFYKQDIVLIVYKDNKPAINFYKKVGFILSERCEEFYTACLIY